MPVTNALADRPVKLKFCYLNVLVSRLIWHMETHPPFPSATACHTDPLASRRTAYLYDGDCYLADFRVGLSASTRVAARVRSMSNATRRRLLTGRVGRTRQREVQRCVFRSATCTLRRLGLQKATCAGAHKNLISYDHSPSVGARLTSVASCGSINDGIAPGASLFVGLRAFLRGELQRPAIVLHHRVVNNAGSGAPLCSTGLPKINRFREKGERLSLRDRIREIGDRAALLVDARRVTVDVPRSPG